jgi:hypothetical protein
MQSSDRRRNSPPTTGIPGYHDFISFDLINASPYIFNAHSDSNTSTRMSVARFSIAEVSINTHESTISPRIEHADSDTDRIVEVSQKQRGPLRLDERATNATADKSLMTRARMRDACPRAALLSTRGKIARQISSRGPFPAVSIVAKSRGIPKIYLKVRLFDVSFILFSSLARASCLHSRKSGKRREEETSCATRRGPGGT